MRSTDLRSILSCRWCPAAPRLSRSCVRTSPRAPHSSAWAPAAVCRLGIWQTSQKWFWEKRIYREYREKCIQKRLSRSREVNKLWHSLCILPPSSKCTESVCECKVVINLLSALYEKRNVNVVNLKCKVESSETEFRLVFLISVSINFPFTSTPAPDGCAPGVGETRQLSQN